jgi:hypothetical protein
MNSTGPCQISPAGYFSNDSSCTICLSGKYAGIASKQCKPCVEGTYSSTGSSSCQICEIGFYNDVTQASTCTACPFASTTSLQGSVDISSCSICTSGYFRVNGSCQDCPAGRFSLQNSSHCGSCPLGKFSDRNSSSCMNCSAGTYADKADSSICVPCLPGKFSPFEASTNSSFCKVCSKGSFSTTGSPNCTLCARGTWSNIAGATTCNPCPSFEGVICEPGSEIPGVGEGYYRSLSHPGLVFSCNPEEACPASGNSSTVCASAYTGIICASCNSQHYRTSGKCIKCLPAGVRWIIVAACLIAVFLVLSLFSANYKKIPESYRITIFWLQFLSLFPSLSFSWPDVLLNLFNMFDIFNFDMGYLGMSCDLSSGAQRYYTILILKIVLPCLFGLFMVLESVLQLLIRKIERINWMKIASSTLHITNFFCIQLFSSMLQVFNCKPSGNGIEVISQEPGIQCYDSSWTYFVVIDGVFMFLYLLVFPTYGIIGYKLATKRMDEDTRVSLIGPLTHTYTEGSEWFEFVKIIFRFGFILARDGIQMSFESKITFLGFLLMALQWFEAGKRPYKTTQLNDLSFMYAHQFSELSLTSQ